MELTRATGLLAFGPDTTCRIYKVRSFFLPPLSCSPRDTAMLKLRLTTLPHKLNFRIFILLHDGLPSSPYSALLSSLSILCRLSHSYISPFRLVSLHSKLPFAVPFLPLPPLPPTNRSLNTPSSKSHRRPIVHSALQI